MSVFFKFNIFEMDIGFRELRAMVKRALAHTVVRQYVCKEPKPYPHCSVDLELELKTLYRSNK